jgi:hypothetical protein
MQKGACSIPAIAIVTVEQALNLLSITFSSYVKQTLSVPLPPPDQALKRDVTIEVLAFFVQLTNSARKVEVLTLGHTLCFLEQHHGPHRPLEFNLRFRSASTTTQTIEAHPKYCKLAPKWCGA